jgi:hypothetical protein
MSTKTVNRCFYEILFSLLSFCTVFVIVGKTCARLRIPKFGCPQGLLGVFKVKRRVMPVFVILAGNTQFKEYVASEMCNWICSFSVRA